VHAGVRGDAYVHLILFPPLRQNSKNLLLLCAMRQMQAQNKEQTRILQNKEKPQKSLTSFDDTLA